MKAVNLLPPELRGTPKAAAAAPAVGGDGTGAFVVLGVLAALVVALAGYVLTNNTVAERKSELAAATQQQEAAARATAQLKPYADFETLVNARVQTVTDLATSRFDWEQALRDLSRALPSDVTLTSLKGTVSSAATGGGNALRGALDVPAVELAGCARSQTTVAGLMVRLRNVDGVTRVSLSKSDKDTVVNSSRPATSGGTVSNACGKGNPPAFEVVAFFEGQAAAAVDPAGVAASAAAPAAGGATTATAAATPAAATADAQPGGTTAPTGTTDPTTPVSTGDAK
jgi:Tfp pilus assembly protein PilN